MEQASLSWVQVILFDMFIVACVYLGQKSKNKYIVFLAFVFLALASGLRHGYIDTRQYRFWFDGVNSQDVLSFAYIFNSADKDKGFNVLIGIIKLFTQDSQVYLFIFAFITIACLFYGLKSNVKNASFTLAVFLFLATGCYLDTMNGMRQAFVGAVLFAILPKLIEKKKFFSYIIVVLLLSTIHASALVFLPIYFIADKKVWGMTTWIVLGIGVTLFIFFNLGISNVVVEFLEETEYSGYADEIINANIGVNIFRPFVAMTPIVLSFINKKTEKTEKIYNVAFYMSLLNLIIWLFATRARYFYRLAAYFQPYMILLLCYELYSIKNKRAKTMICMFAVVLFIIWHIYSLYVTGDSFFMGYLKY